MFRSRLVRFFAILLGITAVLYLMVSLYVPTPRRLVFGVDKNSGKVRLVQNTITYLPPHQFYRLEFERRQGEAQRDGFVRIMSKEQVPVTVSYRLRFSIPGERLPDAQRMVRDGWNAWIRARVAEAVSAVTQQMPVEELLSPTSVFSARRDVLRQVVAGHLARSGLQVSAFEISRIEPDRQALLDYKRQELRREARGVAGRVAIFAIDGADWDLLSELSADGRIPNIRALIQGGTTASLQTIQPTVSPLVWASVATGLPPDRHGVIDFIDQKDKSPVDSATRRSPAIWDIAEAFGRQTVAVNWWTAWPAKSGVVTYDTPVTLQADAIYPPQLAQRIADLDVPVTTIQAPQIRRFLNITDAEYDAAVASRNPADPINMFREVLAKTWTDHRVAVNLYQQQTPLLLMVNYEGADVVNHLFAPYHPPYRQGISQTEFRKYWPVAANYYAELDRLIGEWMKVLSDDTTVMIVSAHGFHWRQNRPRTQPQGRSALADHRNPGVFIAYGNQVAPSRASHSISLYDIIPTVLAVLGLPPSLEMPGKHAEWVFRSLPPLTSVRVISYDEFFAMSPGGGGGGDAARYTQNLQTIGHLIDPKRARPGLEGEGQVAQARPIPAEQWGSYAWYNNHGIELRRDKKLAEAADAFEKAIELNPTRPVPYLNLAMTLFERQYYSAADELFLGAIERGLPNSEQWFVDFAALYRSKDMSSRAIAILYKGKERFPQSYLIAANLGSALAQAERYTDGLPELERALGLQPSSTLVLNNIGIYYAKREDYARALDFWNRSLVIDPRQPAIRQAAEAARTHL